MSSARASSSQSLSSTSAESSIQIQISKPTSKRKITQPKTTDQYAISADQWTPIVGAPLPKRSRIAKEYPSNPLRDTNISPRKNNLVSFFETELSPSKDPPDQTNSSDESILVFAEQKVSLYVECFEEMLNTVLEHEHYLFSEPELRVLRKWGGLPYSSRYLFVRLFMRKNSNWFRLDRLQNYKSEINDIHKACRDLCAPMNDIKEPPTPKKNFDFQNSAMPETSLENRALAIQGLGNHSDLVAPINADIPHGIPRIPSPVHVQSTKIYPEAMLTPLSPPSSPPAISSSSDLDFFATMTSENQCVISTDELLERMSLIELKVLAKKEGVNPHTSRDMIIFGLKKATKSQSTLGGGFSSKTKEKKQLSLKYDKKGRKDRQIFSLNSRILKFIGPCIKLSSTICSLFIRLHLIFYRNSSVSEKTMTASVLARFKKRNYPVYKVIREQALFESRNALIRYENALKREKEFDELLAAPPEEVKKNIRLDTKEEKERRRAAKDQRLKKALEVFENIWSEWQAAIVEEDGRQERTRHALSSLGMDVEEKVAEFDRLNYYKRRFRPGECWPLTRIVCKSAMVLSRFREYQREVDVLTALLNQNHFRRGRRGAWYDRLALVLMTHISDSQSDPELREHSVMSALYTCEQGLLDPYTSQSYRLSLARRLNRLDSLLSLPDSHCVQPNEDFLSHPIVTISYQQVDSVREVGKKTTWLSKLDSSHLTVEEACLEYYTRLGWRGFHSESSILTTIFSLLFWDVIFAPVDGAFATPFQSAPLDISTDAFAIVRAPIINDFYETLDSGGIDVALQQLRRTYEREFARKTWCFGINWEKYELQDLLEIVECLGLKAILKICKIFAEDYEHRSGGVPDLCLWDIKIKRCKFVEVKGPKDRLSDKQSTWMNLLSAAAGVDVEVCSVLAI
ncbi:hypothetical protein BY996DRAFT_4585666 [Phakopsora pachyrhizi]|uniref:Fanconi-associated nuclease n=1 Tax=Phakopsora pachyrhizi TaxID=170000 RepID=A0AAV0BBW0_PHAPC|nr:hypothetical protein BY996DRAFT_4585666 [Phakopsora pachyrhizi]CAH7684646.1 hypothetical protein PPACK8108_LOCUS18985 [Phakopsora pachyrhizi]